MCCLCLGIGGADGEVAETECHDQQIGSEDLGQATGDALKVLGEEVVGVDPRLVTVSDLVAGLVPDLLRKLRRVEGSTGLDLVRGREEDRLGGQLVVIDSATRKVVAID